MQSENIYTVIYYFIKDNIVNYIEDNDNNNSLKTMHPKELNKPENAFHYFRPFEPFRNSYEDLIKFKSIFSVWCDEIKSIDLSTQYRKYKPIDYKSYHSHDDAVLFTLKRKNKTEDLKAFQKVSKDEYLVFERCFNAGLNCLNLEYKYDKKDEEKQKPFECYGYDFSRFYAHMLTKISIPKSQGRLCTFENIEIGKLQFGIYRVQINYENKDFTNIFNFSKINNHYTSSTLNYLDKIKSMYGITFILLKPTEEFNYNALVYDNVKTDLVEGKKIFKNWLEELEKIREKLPNNRLVKHLMTTMWGSSIAYKKEFVDDISEYDATWQHKSDISEYKILDNKDDKYIMVKCDDAYKHGLARIKPFLTAYARQYMMKFIIDNGLSNDVIRIHTDCLILPYKFDFTKHEYHPKAEDKSTGNIVFHNAIHYYHVCTKCNCQYRYNDLKNHIC
jgi:hypothetical protein